MIGGDVPTSQGALETAIYLTEGAAREGAGWTDSKTERGKREIRLCSIRNMIIPGWAAWRIDVVTVSKKKGEQANGRDNTVRRRNFRVIGHGIYCLRKETEERDSLNFWVCPVRTTLFRIQYLFASDCEHCGRGLAVCYAILISRRAGCKTYISIRNCLESRMFKSNFGCFATACSLHPTIPLANFVKEIKGGLSYWIKSNRVCSGFSNWQTGYGAFTHSEGDKERLIEYIKRQEEHHRRVSFADELRALLVEAGVEFDEKHLMPGGS
jgi:hypothetical protein